MIKQIIGCFVLIFGINHVLPAQCGLGTNAGPDQTICSPGGQVMLNGSIPGNFLDFYWEPAGGVTNPNSLQTSAFVTQTTSFTLTGTAFDPSNNLVTNPDFEQGAVGFTSDYLNDLNTIFNPGVYTIVTSPDIISSNFPECDDHTTGNGNMMLISGASTPNQNIWCQSIPVTPFTDYSFSAWVGTIVPFNLPELQFYINGVPLGSPYTAPNDICTWTQFYETWNSGPSTVADICIVDQNLANLGNDFALDDIAFSPVCVETDEITVEVITLEANTPLFEVIPCDQSSITLDASTSSTGTGISYVWSSPTGNIVSGANTLTPEVDQAGTYTLTITFDNGLVQCMATSQVTVISDPNAPMAFGQVIGAIDCQNTSATLDGTGSSSGPDITYQWTTLDGAISGPTDQLQATAISPGTYQLLVSNSQTNCSDEISLTIDPGAGVPIAQALDSLMITCLDTTLMLDGSGSSMGMSFAYEWLTQDGFILQDTFSLNPVIAAPGFYTLIVTDTIEQCADSVSVEVLDGQVFPQIELIDAGLINCVQDTFLLDADLQMSANGVVWEWSSMDGVISGNPDSNVVVAQAAGIYTVIAQDTLNGCADTLQTSIQENFNTPELSISTADTLNCLEVTVQLFAQNTSIATSTVYDWSGQVLSGADSLVAQVEVSGWYYLNAQDTLSGCMDMDSVFVSIDTLSPNVDAPINAMIDCQDPVASLTASVMGGGNPLSYSWTSSDGNILGNPDSISIEVDAGGWYFIMVTNQQNGCSASDSTQVDQLSDIPIVAIVSPDTLNCQTSTLILDGSGSSQGINLIYQWTTSDGAINGANNTDQLEVTGAGMYTLEILDTLSQCFGSASVLVTLDTVAPQLSIAPVDFISCQQSEVTLDASASIPGGNSVSITWSTPNGSFVGGQDSLVTVVDGEGEYLLEVLNEDNFCSESISVQVDLDTLSPEIQLDPVQELNCLVSAVQLSGQVVGLGLNNAIAWSTTDGQIDTTIDSLTVSVSSAGQYQLEIINLDNGCSDLETVLVAIDTIAPIADAGATAVLSCSQTDILLDGNASSQGSDITPSWSTQSGVIQDGADTYVPTVTAAGWYVLTLSNNQNGCTALDSVEVTLDANFPVINIEPPIQLDCNNPALSLNALGSDEGLNFSAVWTSMDGQIDAGENTLQPLISTPGSYILSITNETNDCVSLDSVLVTQNTLAPIFSDPGQMLLTCALDSTFLMITPDDPTGSFSFEWSTSDGILQGPSTIQMPLATSSGTYEVLITDQANGCQSNLAVTVQEDVTTPGIQFTQPMELNCGEDEVVLDGSGSTGNDLEFSWTTTTGEIVDFGDSPFPLVASTGWYVLELLDTQNGCSSIDSLEVLGNYTLPVIDFEPADILNCLVEEVILQASVQSTQGNVDLAWATSTGNIVSGEFSLNPTVDEAGTYNLVVIDQDNGCINVALINVIEDLELPILEIASPESVTCIQNEQILDASASSDGMEFIYSWATQTGTILNGTDGLMPEIGTGGTYTLTIQNTENGCLDSASVTVPFDTLSPIITLSPFQNIPCNASSVQLEASAEPGQSFSFSWISLDGEILSGANTSSPLVGSAGTYGVVVTNLDNGCTADAATDISETGIDEVEWQIEQPSCPGDLGTIIIDTVGIGLAPFLYSIDGGNTFETSPDFSNLNPAWYELLIQDAEGCTWELPVQVVEPIGLMVNLPEELTISPGESVVLEPILSVLPDQIEWLLWEPGGSLDCTDCLEPTASPSETTVYTLISSSEFGCIDSAFVRVVVKDKLSIYAPNAFSPDDDGINDSFTLFGREGSIRSIRQLQVFSRWGELMYSGVDLSLNDEIQGWNGRFRGKSAPVGVYTWWAEIERLDGSIEIVKGNVHLLR